MGGKLQIEAPVTSLFFWLRLEWEIHIRKFAGTVRKVGWRCTHR